MNLERALEVALARLDLAAIEYYGGPEDAEAAATLREFLSAGGPAYMHERGWHPEHRTEVLARLKALEDRMALEVQPTASSTSVEIARLEARDWRFNQNYVDAIGVWAKEIAAIRKSLGASD